MNTARLAWKRRARRQRTAAADRTIWESADGRFRVVRSQSLFGLPTVFYSLTIGAAGEWAIAGRHRKRGPAARRCETIFRRRLQSSARSVS